jgi:DNA ligase-1
MLMHGRECSDSHDPTGWYFSEKFDGVRAYWDGTTMYSKYGLPLPIPKEWTIGFPMIPLDGELWMGYEGFHELMRALNKRRVKDQSLLIQNDPVWNDVTYQVFDSTTSGPIPERHAFLTNAINKCKSKNLKAAELTKCESKEHLQICLDEVAKRKGEGLMLYHPTESHVSGRTDCLLKVKNYLDEEAIFQRINPTSYAFVCLSASGVESIVKCGGWDYAKPPPVGTIITVRHSGIFKASGKFKYPFVLRVH